MTYVRVKASVKIVPRCAGHWFSSRFQLQMATTAPPETRRQPK